MRGWLVQLFWVSGFVSRWIILKGGGRSSQLNLLEHVFDEGTLVFNNVLVREDRVGILLLAPEEALLDKERQTKEGV